jgi:alcohol dehydrogenase
MPALVDHCLECASDEDRQPARQTDTDAIVRIDAMTTCHVAIGTVEAVGPAVKTIEVGDRVLARCRDAREVVRVRFADTSTCKVPEGLTDGQLLMLAAFLRGR